MRKIRIYTPQALSSGCELALDAAAAHHIATVLRMAAGNELVLFNGEGGEYQARISHVKKGKVTLQVEAFTAADRESPLHLHLFQGLSRGEHMDFSIQKAVELGVRAITPVFCARSQFKLSGERLEKKLLHWQQIIISAAQQSWRCELPALHPPLPYAEAVAQQSQAACNILFAVESCQHWQASTAEQRQINCWIGPEGGFTAQEVALARNADMRVASLGPRVLRTETAAVSALSLLQYFAGDLNPAR